MSAGWKAKRFWTEVTVAEAEGEGEGGFAVHLDGRRVMTPGKLPLTLPTRPMAEAVAGEWAAQQDEIRPLSMPVTRAANSAIERVAPNRAEVAAMLAAYGETDLTCHRAETPERLAARQTAAWDPLLDWLAERHGARLVPTAGLLPVDQPRESLAALSEHVSGLDAFRLTGLHDLVTLSGSIVIGLAVAHDHLDPATGWTASRIDEDWQIEQWGRDEEADASAAFKRQDFHRAKAFWELSLSA